MAGISDEDIQRVRAATDIVSLFQDRYVLHQRGREFWCCCPFHEEKSPSCKIDPNTQRYYCFGCHETGDAFTFVMKTEDVDFPDAVRRLADRAGIEIKETGGSGVPRSYKERLRGVCRETRDFYHLQLMRNTASEAAAARAYLGGRGLGGGIPKTWQLGFAPGRGALVRHLRGKGYTPKEMIDANVAVDRSGRAQDRFYDRIMFPINDDQGETIAFGGRVVGKGEPKYLNSQTTPLFNKSTVLYGLDRAKAQITATGTAIVVEGYTDVIALHEAGVANAVATLGTALTTQHIRSIARHAAKRIIYLFDGDEAGQRATDRALQFIDESMTPEAGKSRVDLLACTLPDDLDPADFVGQRGADALRLELESARPLIEFGIERHIGRFDTSTPEGRTAAFADAIQILAPIKDSLLAKDYAVMIAGRLMMRENDAIARLAQLKSPRRFPANQAEGFDSAGHQAQPVPVERPVQLPASERNRRRYEAEFIGLCAHYPALALQQAAALAQVNWHARTHAEASEALLAALEDNPAATPAQLSVAVTQAVPQAGRILALGAAEGYNPHLYIAFVAEELALGDLEDQIDSLKVQLHGGTLSADDEQIIAQAIDALARDLQTRRAAHRKADPGMSR